MTPDEWLEIDCYERMSSGWGDIAVDCHVPAQYKLPIRLFDTEFEVGQLTLRLETDDPVVEIGEAHMNYPLDLVMHPTRGVLNVGVVDGGPDTNWLPYLRMVFDRLTMTCDILREEIKRGRVTGERDRFWTHRELPFGPALILHGTPAEIEPEAIGAPPDVIVTADWEGVPDALGRVMDFHAPDIPPTETYLARKLATALKTYNDQYIDHIGCIATWQEIVDQIFEPDEPKAA